MACVFVLEGKQKSAAGGPDGKNHRASGDINGNLVAVPPVIEGNPISCTITSAQLLANPRAVDVGEEMKCHPVGKNRRALEDIDGNIIAACVAIEGKPISCHITSSQLLANPQVATEVSFVSNEEKQESASKKVHPLNSDLTAGSQAACGFTDKIKDPIPDIDANDVGNQLAVAEYVKDIYKFYKHSESLSRPRNYKGSQVQVDAKMWTGHAEWLISAHDEFNLSPECLYLTFNVMARYVSSVKALRWELELVGISAMLIASKYEEIMAPEVHDFLLISDGAYSHEQILEVEKEILNKLEWTLTVPTPYVFLVRFIKAAMCDKEMEYMVYFFAEMGLTHYSMTKYRPSMFAASAVYATRCTLKKIPLWTETLEYYTGFSEPQLLDCAERFVKCHSAARKTKWKKAAYRKYSSIKLGAVSLHPPATKLLKSLKENLLSGLSSC